MAVYLTGYGYTGMQKRLAQRGVECCALVG